MANETISPNMNLPIPGVGATAGPQYAVDLDSCMTIIDQHNHTSGNGVPINPGGLNINSDLPINGNNLTLVRSVRMQSQGSPISGASDLDCLSVSGVDLYYRDGNGNSIRMTQSGSIVGSAGSITGLPSGTASASYAAGTFVWQSATNTAATMDMGSIILRNMTASSFGVTVSVPGSLGSNYNLVLPSIPGVTSVMTLDNSGNMGTKTYDQIGQGMTNVGADAIGVSMDSTGANAIGASMTSTGSDAVGSSMSSVGADAVANSRTRTVSATAAPAGGILVGGLGAGGSGSFSSASTSYINVTNMNGTIVCTGRPIVAFLASNAGVSYVGQTYSSGAIVPASAKIQITRDGSTVGQVEISGSVNAAQANLLPTGSVYFIDFPSIGTHTYNLQALTNVAGMPVVVNNCLLVVYEL